MKGQFEAGDVRLERLSDGNVEEYLHCKRYASMYAKAYEQFDGLWEYMKAGVLETVHDGNIRMLVCNRSGECVGYIEAETDTRGICGINVGVLPEYRNHNIASIASKKFVDYLFQETDIPFIIWYAHKSNIASCRVAEKIGGKYIGQGDLLKSWLEQEGSLGEDKDIPEESAYLIERK